MPVNLSIKGALLIGPTLLPFEMAGLCLKKIKAHPVKRELPTSRSSRRGHARFSQAGLALFLTAIICFPISAGAQSLEPRAYSNLPIGMNFLIAGYAYQQGDVLLDPSLPLKDVNMQIHSAVLAYARSLDLFGKSGRIDLLVPYAYLSGTGKLLEEERSREVSGLADPMLRFYVNFYGAPALSFEEFKKLPPGHRYRGQSFADRASGPIRFRQDGQYRHKPLGFQTGSGYF